MLYLHTQGTLNLHYLAITSISTQAYKNVMSSRVNVKTLCTALTIVAKTSDGPNKVRPLLLKPVIIRVISGLAVVYNNTF